MADRIPVTFSAEQQEGTQSILSQWFKKVGDFVRENEPLAEVSTDKVNVEIASPASGVLTKIIAEQGASIEPGMLLAEIEKRALEAPSPGAAKSSVSQSSGAALAASAGGGKDAASDISPAVRKLIKEHGIDPSKIHGSGKGGRITHDDVLNYIKTGSTPSGAPCAAESIPSRRVPLSPMRRQIAQHMVQSLLHTAPHVTSVFQADLSAIISHRNSHKLDFEKRGARLTLTAYFVFAAAKALRKVPEVNSRYHEKELEIFEDCNIGVATAVGPEEKTTQSESEAGLIVPVLQRAQTMDLFQVASRLQELTTKAREGKLSPAEVRGGTFTISNHGVSGSLMATPIIISQPQSAILGIGKLEKRAIVVEQNGRDELTIRPMVYVTLTLDHRVLDGLKANAFLSEFVQLIERFE